MYMAFWLAMWGGFTFGKSTCNKIGVFVHTTLKVSGSHIKFEKNKCFF